MPDGKSPHHWTQGHRSPVAVSSNKRGCCLIWGFGGDGSNIIQCAVMLCWQKIK